MPEPVIEIADGLAILRALEALRGRPFEWAELTASAIDRVTHAIFPLAVVPVDDSHGPEASARLQESARRLEQDCIHFYGGDGFHAEMLLDVDAGFGRRLVESSVLVSTPRYWWGIGRFAAVIVHSIEQRRAFETLALHIIPKDWVWISPITPSTKRDASHARRVIREQETVAGVAEVLWSWPWEADARPEGADD